MSERLHLPPSAHCTFEAPGFVVCTFTPRPLEGDSTAERVPWYHRNIDYDEVFFVHQGEFTLSRSANSNRSAGIMTLNPGGLHHGPHPGVQEASRERWRSQLIGFQISFYTDEKAKRAGDRIQFCPLRKRLCGTRLSPINNSNKNYHADIHNSVHAALKY